MAHRRKLGTSIEPIEILDSDDDPQTFGYSSVIDLTQDDLALSQTPEILQQLATQKKVSPASSALDPHSPSRRPLGLASRQCSFMEGQNTSPNVESEAKTSIPLISLPVQVLHTENEGLIGECQQLMSEGDADSELSDVMDRPRRRRLRRARERSSRILEAGHPVIPMSSSTLVKESSPKVADSLVQRTHYGKIRQWICVQG
jgi:hypothetical protein